MRILAVALLMMVSMDAGAKVNVEIGSFVGGTIKEKGQTDPDEKGLVTVTITVTPDDGYTIKSSDITVVSTYPAIGSRATRSPEIAGNLTLEGKDPSDLSKPRDYKITVKSNFGIWVKEANFKSSGKGPNRNIDYTGIYYIASDYATPNTNTAERNYDATTLSNNYYLCPTDGWIYYQPTNKWSEDGTTYPNPFLTTFKCRTAAYNSYGGMENAAWIITKHGDYYAFQHIATSQYMLFSGQISGCGADRMRVHLETVTGELPNSALFSITVDDRSVVFHPYEVSTDQLTVNGGNKDALTGQSGKTGGPSGYSNTAGIIGIYRGDDDSRFFYLEKAAVDAPVITPNFTATNTFTITADEGATIYYTTDGTTPTTSTPTTGTTSVSINQTESMEVIKAIAKGANDLFPSFVTTYELPKCDRPDITISGGYVNITSATEEATIHYTTDGTPATSSSPTYTGPFAQGSTAEIRAIATKPGYVNSSEATLLPPTEVSSSDQITDMRGRYILADNFVLTGSIGTSNNPFRGYIDGNMVTRDNLGYPLVAYAEDATIKNVILKDVNLSGGTNVGAICNEAKGACRIYNCGVLGTLSETKDENGKVTNITSTSTISGSGYVGSIVGLLDGTSRVINCYSYATVSGGTYAAGIVGYNKQTSSQTSLKTIIVNCMFYGDITGGNKKYPVFGNLNINNNSNTGINPYCYFRKNATFTPTSYNTSWPAEEKNLTRFEYYRSVLNSNRKLCTWWVNGTDNTVPTDDDVSDVGIAKWVLDPTIAPYPILKTWGKYPSIINPDPDNRFNPETKSWEPRSTANEWEGKSYNTLRVTVNAGLHGSGSIIKDITITDMDTLNYDYGYYKIQLPYYNDVFGNPNGATHAEKYGNNYMEYVVTGWDISSSGGAEAFENYNFANRNCTEKDNVRVFAQGGFYYVPNNVSSITITAHWGKAFYLANRGYSIDRVKVTGGGYRQADGSEAYNFAPAGTVPNTFQGYTVYSDLQQAIMALGTSGTVYDQAIVLIGNHQVKNGGTKNSTNSIGYNLDNKWHPFTIMSVDLDFDDEPDYCLQLQFRQNTDRPGVQPIRFDFLPVIELGLAVRHNNLAYAIGLMVPQGHFEITETALMRTTQFEWDAANNRIETESPVILNGGEFDQLAVRWAAGNRTSYFLLGGHLWFHRFAPGSHPLIATANIGNPRLCPVSVIGGDFPEFYLSGLYRPDKTPPADQGNPKCYINGGHFGKIHGSGYDKINGSVTFKIDHAAIGEFYGGGINGSNPIGGNIDVTIDNSRVDKYCGGPEVGDMTNRTVTTNATGTTFGVYYGGGNGGNSYYRDLQKDGDQASENINQWGINPSGQDTGYNFNIFDPLGVKDDDVANENKGYHAEYEFEVFNQSNGVADQITQRGFIKWIQFGITTTGNVVNTLNNCTVEHNFYGGGNLASVNGTVTSTLTNTTVKGSAYGAGYSAAIPTFHVHDKSTVSFPSITAGVITDGHIDYDSREFEWTNDLNGMSESDRKASPTYEIGGKWYCYTWNSLENLGTVMGTATLNIEGTTTVGGSVYGGGEESGVDGDTEVNVTGGTIGTPNLGGADYGNVYGGGRGNDDDVKAGVVKGNTAVNISGDAEHPFIYHNVYGGGAYGSVGTFSYDANQNIIGYTSGGTCTVTVTGGKIGTNGKENGMVFGSSRGDVSRPVNGVDPNDHLAWVHDTHVIIGTANSTELTYPQINGSIYGSGENGHTYTNTVVDIHSGTVGIPSGEAITMKDGKDYDGPRFPNRGNVYGGGCGTDTYTVDEDGNGSADTNSEGKTKQYFNLNAGIVLGNCTVNIDGGHVVHNVYGAGAMGSAGTFTTSEGKPSSCAAETGVCNVNVSGGMVGMPGARMTATNGPDDFGHVFGAGRGEVHDSTEYVNMNIVGYVKESHVAISDNAFITGSVYGGSESGHVLGDTYVTVSGGQIGCGENQTEAYSEQAFTNAFDDAGNVVNPLEECAHWTYDTHNSPYDKFSGDDGYEGSGGLKTATDGHTFYGNVFGGGSGYYPYAPGKWVRSAGLVEGSTHVLIEGGHILSNVYGGNEHTDVYGSCTVTMTGGTVGVPRTWSQKRAEPVLGNLFGAGKGDKRVLFNQWTNVTSTTVTVSGGTVYGSVFGGGEDGHVLGDAETTISGASTVIGTLGTTGYDGNVFGGGRGSYTALTAGVVCGNVNLNIEDGYMKGSVYGGGRLASVGTHLADVSQEDYYGRIISDGKKQIIGEDDEDAEGVTHGHITIVISGGTIGAVKDGRVLTSQYSLGDVFGGCKGTTEGTILEKLGIAKSAVVNLLGGTVGNSIYGGGEVGFVGERGLVDAPETAFAKVNLLGGSVKNVYGGGLGLKDGVGGAQSNAPALVRGNVKVNLNGLEPDDYNSTIHSSVVTGLNEDGNEGVDFYRVNNRVDGCVVTGNIFGCNNVNGTPEGHAKLHVFMTTPESRQLPEPGQTSDNYDVAAVYGGGNQADYVPTDDEQKTEVIIEGCGLTSIQQVYGGGNAAATPGTLVTVKGTELIDEVFGGGNGVSTDDFDNPGANVGIVTGTETPYTLGDGVALVRLMAGNIHYAYGGSNTKGDIRGGSSVETVDNEWIENVSTACCEELHVDEMYGGGKNAGMKSGTNIILGCSNSTNWVNEIYAGAENADVEGDCSLTITSGMFKRVFGGNKFSGKLKGSITVNIEENGQCGVPIIIGELYGGGNKAPYSVYGYDNNGSMLTSGERKYNDPVVNVRSFTSIGNIYGGGYGSGAIMYGNTNVNINETLNHQADAESYSGNAYPGGVLHLVTTLEEVDVKLYPHEDGKIGVIGNVFGGGNAAAVYGNTNVNIGTTAEEPLQQLDNNGNPLYEDVVVEGVTKKQPVKILTPVVGADIQGNVYGGGNEAIVTGDTNVTIGKDGSSL